MAMAGNIGNVTGNIAASGSHPPLENIAGGSQSNSESAHLEAFNKRIETIKYIIPKIPQSSGDWYNRTTAERSQLRGLSLSVRDEIDGLRPLVVQKFSVSALREICSKLHSLLKDPATYNSISILNYHINSHRPDPTEAYSDVHDIKVIIELMQTVIENNVTSISFYCIADFAHSIINPAYDNGITMIGGKDKENFLEFALNMLNVAMTVDRTGSTHRTLSKSDCIVLADMCNNMSALLAHDPGLDHGGRDSLQEWIPKPDYRHLLPPKIAAAKKDSSIQVPRRPEAYLKIPVGIFGRTIGRAIVPSEEAGKQLKRAAENFDHFLQLCIDVQPNCVIDKYSFAKITKTQVSPPTQGGQSHAIHTQATYRVFDALFPLTPLFPDNKGKSTISKFMGIFGN